MVARQWDVLNTYPEPAGWWANDEFEDIASLMGIYEFGTKYPELRDLVGETLGLRELFCRENVSNLKARVI